MARSVREIDRNDDKYVGIRFPLGYSPEGFFYKTKMILLNDLIICSIFLLFISFILINSYLPSMEACFNKNVWIIGE